jgi:hypothetical protein
VSGRLKAVPKDVPRAPEHLEPATRAWWERVVADWALDDHHVRLLTLAAESWDRCAAGRQVLGKLGLSYVDRFGAPRTRPEVAIERGQPDRLRAATASARPGRGTAAAAARSQTTAKTELTIASQTC